jgi:hypothetical protein
VPYKILFYFHFYTWPNSEILESYIEFLFFIQFWCVFSFLLLLNGLCYVLWVVCQQFPQSFRNNVSFVLIIMSSYWLKTVLVWNGVQGKLQKGCLETTVRYGSMCKKGLWQCQKYYAAWLEDPKYWGPRLHHT